MLLLGDAVKIYEQFHTAYREFRCASTLLSPSLSLLYLSLSFLSLLSLSFCLSLSFTFLLSLSLSSLSLSSLSLSRCLSLSSLFPHLSVAMLLQHSYELCLAGCYAATMLQQLSALFA